MFICSRADGNFTVPQGLSHTPCLSHERSGKRVKKSPSFPSLAFGEDQKEEWKILRWNQGNGSPLKRFTLAVASADNGNLPPGVSALRWTRTSARKYLLRRGNVTHKTIIFFSLLSLFSPSRPRDCFALVHSSTSCHNDQGGEREREKALVSHYFQTLLEPRVLGAAVSETWQHRAPVWGSSCCQITGIPRYYPHKKNDIIAYTYRNNYSENNQSCDPSPEAERAVRRLEPPK